MFMHTTSISHESLYVYLFGFSYNSNTLINIHILLIPLSACIEKSKPLLLIDKALLDAHTSETTERPHQVRYRLQYLNK